ncbi:hypothetical protein BASA81_015412 [Batrachochytrium salamandrivorans]|nr:hypothetical protein BASA81_015412 [Batrachochytrium salamandrivorans]
MQHTDILELNACIAFLRPGRGGGATGLDKYDMTHTFVDGRDHHLTALFANSPPPDESALAWVATPQEIKQDQQRRQKEREMEDLRKSMRKQQPQQQQQQQQQQAPVELALTSPKPLAVLTFERKFVVGGGGEKKSALTQDLTRAKLDGGVVTGDSNNSGSSSRANAPTNGPSVKLIIFLPDRTPLEIRVSKTATVEHAIVAVLERTLIQGKRRKNYKGFEMRMHDEDGIPDEDFPALDASQNIAEIGAGEYCLVDLGIPELPMVATTSPSPVVLTPAVLPSSQRKQSLSKAGVIHVVFVDIEHHDQHGSSQKVDLLDSRASQFLKKVVKAVQLPLIADEYQFHVTEQDRDRLQVVSTVVHPNDDVLALGVEMLLLRKRRYADAPPDLDVSALGGNNKLPATPERITATPLAQPLPQLLPVYKHSTIKPPVVSTTTTTTTAATTTATTTTVAATTGLSKKLTTVSVASANAITMPTSAQLQVKHSFAGGVDPNTILLNEIKAAVYEEWKVTKTNNWGKRQARILGIDLTKIYNKTQSTTSGGGGGGGGRVKNAERLIADVVSIELNTANAAAFTIKPR